MQRNQSHVHLSSFFILMPRTLLRSEFATEVGNTRAVLILTSLIIQEVFKILPQYQLAYRISLNCNNCVENFHLKGIPKSISNQANWKFVSNEIKSTLNEKLNRAWTTMNLSGTFFWKHWTYMPWRYLEKHLWKCRNKKPNTLIKRLRT